MTRNYVVLEARLLVFAAKLFPDHGETEFTYAATGTCQILVIFNSEHTQ
jgi:hypothetical protein